MNRCHPGPGRSRSSRLRDNGKRLISEASRCGGWLPHRMLRTMVAFPVLAGRGRQHLRPVDQRLRQRRNALMPADQRSPRVVGSGFIGRAWAITFARAGRTVRLVRRARYGRSGSTRLHRQRARPDLAANDLLLGPTAAEVRCAFRRLTDLGQALAGADHVQENTPGRASEIKRRMFPELDRLAPQRCECSPAQPRPCCPPPSWRRYPARGAMPRRPSDQPPYLIPAVEMVPAPWTIRETVERRVPFMTAVGQAPIVMKREIDGFVMNWMQGALARGGLSAGRRRLCSVEDVDVGIREGLALSWSFMGPFETIDLNAPGGVRDYVERYQGIYVQLFPSMQRARRLVRTCAQGRRGRPAGRKPRRKLVDRQRWRDRRLMATAPHKRARGTDIGDIARELEVGSWLPREQGHHHLRGDRRDPHAHHVALSADHAARHHAAEAVGAAEAGAAILHLHARDPETGKPDQTPAAFGRFLPRIKQATNAVINITTGGALICGSRSACSRPCNLQARSRVPQHGFDQFRPVPHCSTEIQGVQVRLGAGAS